MGNDIQNELQAIAIPLSVQERTGEGFGFIAYANSRVEKLQNEGRYDAANKLSGYIRRFVAYLGCNEVSFNDFNALLVRNYHAWLENKKLGRNTISLYIRNLKRVYRLAVDDGLAVDSNPFEGMDVSYHAKKDKNGLTLNEVKRLRDLDLSDRRKSVVFARDIFLFSVYAHGMMSDDIFRLTKNNIRDGQLVYHQRLTGKIVSILWEPMLQEITARYVRDDSPLLFPVITVEGGQEYRKQYDSTLRSINRNLKELGKMIGVDYPLNLTVAHHSWECMTKSVSISDLL